MPGIEVVKAAHTWIEIQLVQLNFDPRMGTLVVQSACRVCPDQSVQPADWSWSLPPHQNTIVQRELIGSFSFFKPADWMQNYIYINVWAALVYTLRIIFFCFVFLTIGSANETWNFFKGSGPAESRCLRSACSHWWRNASGLARRWHCHAFADTCSFTIHKPTVCFVWLQFALSFFFTSF